MIRQQDDTLLNGADLRTPAAQKQAFVVGKTSDGKGAGLKTTVVET
jgi:hypothetical protein